MTGRKVPRVRRPTAQANARRALTASLLALSMVATWHIVPANASHTVLCRADLPVRPGEPLTWRAFVTGGSGAQSYSWSGTGGLAGASAVVTKFYDSVGYKEANVTVTDESFGDQVTTGCAMHVVPATHSEPPNVTPVLWVPRDIDPAPLAPRLRRVWRWIHAGFYHHFGKTFKMNPMEVIVSPDTEADICGGDCTEVGMSNQLMARAWDDARTRVGGFIPYTRAVLVSAWGAGGFAGAFSWDLAHGGVGDWSLGLATGGQVPAIEKDASAKDYLIYRNAVGTMAHELNHLIGWDDPHDFGFFEGPSEYEKQVSLAGPFLTETPTDVTKPVVRFSGPPGATLSGTVPIAVDASDDVAMDAVILTVDDQFMAIDRSPPFAPRFDTTSVGHGEHLLEVFAHDSSGNTSSVTREVVVENQVAENSCSETFPIGTFHVCYFDGAGIGGPYLGTLLDHPFPVPATNAGWGLRHNWEEEIAFGESETIGGVWRGTLDLPTGNYALDFFTDDGLRVRVNNQLVIDEWSSNQVANFTTVAFLSGPTRIQIEWFENFGSQALVFQWDPTAAPAEVTAHPSSVAVVKGFRRGGGATSLASDDNLFFSVGSTTAATRTATWIGKFDGIPNNLTDPRVLYRGKNSRTCFQGLAIKNWTANKWVPLDARSVGTTEVEVADTPPQGDLARFVSGAGADGSVWIRVRCSSPSTAFSSQGDLMQLTYQHPG